MSDELREYRDDDFESVRRIWQEVGWIEDKEEHTAGLRAFVSCGRASVAAMNGTAECFVHWVPGSIRHGTTEVAFAAVTAVTTSRIARRRGFASRLTAGALAEAAESGAALAGLGIFDQGFYDRLGFGTGTYNHLAVFDPASLRVDVEYRTPERISTDDWADLHEAMTNRMRGHGGVVLAPPQCIQAEMLWDELPFGLGFREDGRLTHALFGAAKDEHGPYTIRCLAYENPRQLLELLRVIQELGDQVTAVKMPEPPEIQLQDLLDRPFRHRNATAGAKNPASMRADAWWQIRVLDVATCVAAHSWVGEPFRFRLELTDPLATVRDSPWDGIGGSYDVEVGESCSAQRATGDAPADLAVLRASVGAFSRLWWGTRPASSLAITDDLDGSPELIGRLDAALCLPTPRLGWDF